MRFTSLRLPFLPSLALAALLAVVQVTPAGAQLLLNENEEPKVKVQLIAEQDAIAPGKGITVALRQEITPQWHTYWSNPGDTGLATTLEWDLPEGFSASGLQFPTPRRHPMAGMMNYGYEDSVMLLATVTAPGTLQTGTQVTLKAKANWLVCKDICLPESADVTLTLDVRDDPAPGAWASAFTAARKTLPQGHNATQKASIEDTSLVVSLEPMPLPGDTLPEEAYFYPHDGLLIDHTAPQKATFTGRAVRIATKLNTARTTPVKTVTGDLWLRGATGEHSFTFKADVPAPMAEPVTEKKTALTAQDDAPDKENPSSSSDSAAAQNAQGKPAIGFWTAILFAFLGGIILNLMPCVFPVLSLKALGLVHKAHNGKRGAVIASGVAYLGGVLATFTLLGLVLAAFKAAGGTFGWGAQLQSPNFVAATALLLFFIGYYLSGAVELGGGRIQNIGARIAGQDNLTGSFFTGALAVLVATPCTAPFMGGAIFYALTQDTFVTLAVLWSLGFGLALPYVILTLFPALLLRYLPKPGIWMEHFKQFLAFPMLAAAVWLVWVLAQQTGATGVVLVLGAMLLLAFGFWLWRTTHNRPATAWQLAKMMLSIAFVACAVLLALSQPDPVATQQATQAASSGNNEVTAFTPESLRALRAENKAVFVNMTAAWCITCLANEKAALATQDVQEFFNANHITYMKGDWTNYDPAITDYLGSFGRSGVPIYVFYPADATKQPVVLPQLLTPAVVIEAIQPHL